MGAINRSMKTYKTRRLRSHIVKTRALKRHMTNRAHPLPPVRCYMERPSVESIFMPMTEGVSPRFAPEFPEIANIYTCRKDVRCVGQVCLS